MIKKEFIPYEFALELKQLGFDEPCFAYLKPNVLTYEITIGEFNEFEYHSAPTYSQAFRWFREQYNLCGWVKVEYEYGRNVPSYCITGKRQGDIYGGLQNTYEEAELACLKKLIEIVSNSKVALQK